MPGQRPAEQLLRVGIIGLGRRWRRRYRPALQALTRRFQVSALCDQVAERATLEAGRLGCAAAAGPTELLERADVDALLLLDPQWYGLWPLELACRVGKPVFCGVSLPRDADHADRIYQAGQDSRLPVMMAMPLHVLPVLRRLRALLAEGLGEPRTLLAWVAGSAADPCRSRTANDLLNWCATLLPATAPRLLATGLPGGELVNLLLDQGAGRGMQLTWTAVAGAATCWRLQVIAARGMAEVEPPGTLRWITPEGRYSQTLSRRRGVGRALLTEFRRAVQAGQLLRPSLADAYETFCWLRQAAGGAVTDEAGCRG